MKITKTMQMVASDILNEFAFIRDEYEFFEAYNRVFERYALCNDPFTDCPCTSEEYYKNKLEYERQTMYEMYGHCDGLD